MNRDTNDLIAKTQDPEPDNRLPECPHCHHRPYVVNGVRTGRKMALHKPPCHGAAWGDDEAACRAEWQRQINLPRPE